MWAFFYHHGRLVHASTRSTGTKHEVKLTDVYFLPSTNQKSMTTTILQVNLKKAVLQYLSVQICVLSLHAFALLIMIGEL